MEQQCYSFYIKKKLPGGTGGGRYRMAENTVTLQSLHTPFQMKSVKQISVDTFCFAYHIWLCIWNLPQEQSWEKFPKLLRGPTRPLSVWTRCLLGTEQGLSSEGFRVRLRESTGHD